MVHSVKDECGYAGKTVRSLENACHTWAPRRCIHERHYTNPHLPLPYLTYFDGSWCKL